MARQSGGAVLLAGFAILAGMYLGRDGSVDKPAPDFSLPKAYGGQVKLESYRGHPLLLAFWATSCGICRYELPVLSRLAPEFRRKGVEILAIHLGDGDQARDYMRSNHIDLPSASDTEGAVGQAYRVGGIPKLVLIAGDGRIKRTSSGAVREQTLRGWVESVRTR